MNLKELKPNPDNPRTISEEQFTRLVGKIKRNPDGLSANKIVYKDGIIIAGNQRFRALTQLGLEPKEEWFKDVSGWTDEQIREYLVTSNVSDGAWDWDILANQYELEDLEAWGVELPVQLQNEEVEEDEAPPVADVAISKLGEIYQLGRHRLMCGDSTDFGQVSDLMDGQEADMLFTDPPYNVNYQSAGGNGYSEGKYKHEKIFNDNKSDEEFTQFLKDVASAYDSVLKDNTPIYVWHGDSSYNAVPFYEMFKSVDWYRASTLCWVKESQTMTWQHYKPKHEVCSYGWKGKKVEFKNNDETTIWELNRDKTTKYDHPTQKPIGLAGRAIGNHKVDIVIDAFGGSGSTLIACEQLDRTCYMMELDPKYCDVIRKRYWKFVNEGNEEGWEQNTGAIQVVENAVS